ncbi:MULTISPECIES: hypothetical protein [unclassified Mesorhizobium]|uniref:hypothetical protein n=1 Tax=unclassified Mesorhizobium TaxID=325217 RepID=UPI00333C1FA5
MPRMIQSTRAIKMDMPMAVRRRVDAITGKELVGGEGASKEAQAASKAREAEAQKNRNFAIDPRDKKSQKNAFVAGAAGGATGTVEGGRQPITSG